MARRSVVSGTRNSITKAARKNFRLDGLADVNANIARVLASVDPKAARSTAEKAKKVYVDAAVAGRNEIRAITPVSKDGTHGHEPGNLRDSVFAARGSAYETNALLGVNHRKAPYAHNVEFGHGGPHAAPPHPFFRPGVEYASREMSQIIKAGLRKVIEEAPKPTPTKI